MTYKKKLIEVALPLAVINDRVGPREVDSTRTSLDTSPVVGAPSARRCACRPVGVFGRRSVRSP